VEIERDGRRLPADAPALEALRSLAVRDGFEPEAELPPLCGGAVGFLSYDAVRLFEEIPDRHPAEGQIPDVLFLLFDSVVAFDHARQRLLLLTCADLAGRGWKAQAEAAVARLDRLEAFLGTPEPASQLSPSPPAPTPSAGATGFSAVLPRARFLEAVVQAKEAILAGEIYQVVLSQRWTGRLGVDPFEVYRALRSLNPSPYLFYLETREAAIVGASPEMLVRCRGRTAETRPIAGTIRRGKTAEEDAILAARLLSDPKERAEHVMLVDLGRNDLGRVCEIGSIRVTRSAEVERYSHVQHIVSEVRGTLAPGRNAIDALGACFPAGTLTGAPKIRAMELIDALEGSRRGIYGGAVGYLDCAGDLDMAIAIRTAVVEKGVCRIQAGAGIVADSIPENEYREAESKAEALFRAVEIARSAASGPSAPGSWLPAADSR
jgi:anthranilate synthase component 1